MAYTVINNLLLKLIGLYEFYGTAIIDFDDIRQKHLGCSHDVATRKIKSGGLPFVTFRLADSQKGKLFVHVDDLTELVERQRERARKEIQKHISEFKDASKGNS
ncbi:pyocin activator PrtN family protein [Pseudoalteromonas sp. Angola-31]|nr:pyocin activator PrtN family protein [Pseudoalteromonas sp. Angola-31]